MAGLSAVLWQIASLANSDRLSPQGRGRRAAPGEGCDAGRKRDIPAPHPSPQLCQVAGAPGDATLSPEGRGGDGAESICDGLSHPRWNPNPSPKGRGERPWPFPSLALALTLLATPAFAQALPYHADPSAREILPSTTSIPAIRFLTTADFPPFNFRDAGGELIGFNVDLAKRICAEVNVACTIQAWPWEQAADALTDNQGDALIAGLDLSDDNGALFDFSAIYLALPGRFVARAADVPAFDPAGLAGRTVAVRRGSTHEAFMRRYLPDVTLSGFDDEIGALAAVRDAQADAFFGDAMRASFWLNEHLDCCSFAGEAYFRPGLFGEGLAIAVPAGHDAVRHAIDWALVRLKDDGVLDELYLRWFPVGFY